MTEKEILTALDKRSQIIIYGAGYVGRLFLKRMLENGICKEKIVFMVSNNDNEQYHNDVPIYVVGELKLHDAAIVIATMPDKHVEIERNLREIYADVHIIRIESGLLEEMKKNHRDHFRISGSDHKPVDILYMSSDNYAASGAFLCMIDLNLALQQMGISTLIVLPILLPSYQDGEDLLIENGLDYTFVESEHWFTDKEEYSMPDNEAAICELERIIRIKHIKLVHNNTIYTYVGALAAQRCGIPYVWHIRENIYHERWKFRNKQYSVKLINQASRVLTTSKYIAESYDDLDKEKVEIVYDGIDLDKCKAKRTEIFSENQINIICVGGIRHLKGQEDLVRASINLKKKKLKFQVRFLGIVEDREYYDSLMGLIEREDLKEYCHFLGYHDDVVPFYEISDIAVVCSRSEAFGRITAEGLVAGLVTIGADCGATPEVLNDEKCGVLYHVGDAEDLTDKILEVAKNRNLYRMIDRKGVERSAEKYSKEKNAEHVRRIYENIINRTV